jgi:DNA-binding transcriptional MerR regulator/methylmalonyl-CoA mutase cobalamin-binding subunit
MDKHPIRIVARRTGLSPDVLRAWEKRYGAVQPERQANRRLYSDADVERLLLLRKATLAGRSIGQLAHLSTAQLQDLVAADEAAVAVAPVATSATAPVSRAAAEPGADAEAASCLEVCVAAARALDGRSLEDALSRSLVDLSPVAAVEKVVVPLMTSVGEMWRDGTLRVAHEHVVSAVVRTFLGGSARGGAEADSAARIVVGTPAGQLHELGALTVAGSAAAEGWLVTYLGPNVPSAEIAAAADAIGARVMALSVTYPVDDPHLVHELRLLRELTGDGEVILVGGSGAGGYADVLREIGAVQLQNLASLRVLLERLRLESPPGGRLSPPD